MMNTVSASTAAQTTNTSSCEHEEGASSLKVRACQPSFAAAIERMPCSLVRHHASLVLADYPTLIVIFHRWKMTISRACGLT